MRRLLIAFVVCAVLVIGVVAAVVIHRLQGEGNIRGSSTEEFVPTTPAPKPPPLGTPWPQYGLRRDARPLGAALAPAAVPEGLVVRRRQPRRVSAVDRLRPPVLLDELRQVRGREHEDGQARVEVPLASLRRRLARRRAVQARDGLRRLPEQAAVQREAGEGRREGDRVRGRLREDPLAEDDRPERELAAPARQPAVRRGLGRPRLGARRAHRAHDLAAHALALADQGRDLVDRRQALRRLVRRQGLLPRRAEGPALLEGEGAAPPLRAGALLLDARARVRARLHRLDRRQGVLVRRDDRPAALVARDGRLRLRVAGRLEGARVRRLVQQALLRLRRRDRRRALDVQGERRDLGLADGRRQRRLLRNARGPHVCAERAHGQAGVDVSRTASTRPSSRCRAASSSSATARCMGWSRDEIRRHRCRGLHRLAARRLVAGGGPRGRRRRLLHRLLRPGREGGERARPRRAPARPRRAAARPRRRRRRVPSRRAGGSAQLRRRLPDVRAAQPARVAARVRGVRAGRRARRLRLVVVGLRRGRGVSDAGGRPSRGRSRRTGSRSSAASTSRARTRPHSGSTRWCCGTSPCTGRASGRTCSSAASARRCSTAAPSRSSAPASSRAASRTSATRSTRRCRDGAGRARCGLQRRRRRGGDHARGDRAARAPVGARRSTSGTSAPRRATSRGRAPTSRASRAALGWQPETSLEDGLARMWSWASARVAAG